MRCKDDHSACFLGLQVFRLKESCSGVKDKIGRERRERDTCKQADQGLERK
jgi:hypothetical protein